MSNTTAIMTGEATRYAYEPLKENEIRVLCLLPGWPGTELEGFIIHVDISSQGNSKSEEEKSESEGENLECEYSETESADSAWSTESSTKPSTGHQNRTSDVSNKVPPWLQGYEALSYVWGPQDPPHSLSVLGETSGLISIGPNLHDALEQLRPVPDQEPRILWVDQICINQADLGERTEQVQKMSTIYKKARKVLIWLGQEDEYTALGFDYARSAYKVTRDNPDTPTVFSKEVRQLSQKLAKRVPRRYIKHHLDHCGNSTYENGVVEWCLAAVYKITHRTWFERTWTFQEVKLARDAELICGLQSLPWKAMEATLSWQQTYALYQPNQEGLELTHYLEPSEHSWAFRTTQHGGVSFLNLLALRKTSKCNDPRDKVVALLGLADEMNKGSTNLGSRTATEIIRPDYQEAVEDLYVRTGHYLVESTLSLELLDYVVPTLGQDKMPSWVPDWRHAADTTGGPDGWFQQATRGSKYPSTLLQNPPEPTKLRVSSIKQDCVCAVSCYDENFDHEFFRKPHGSEIYLPTMQPMELAVKQMMVREEWFGTDQPARAAFFGLKTSVTSGKSTEPQSQDTIEEDVAMLHDRFNKRDPNVHVFRGSKGFIGFGPEGMQVGDEIHLLLGFDCPVALRPLDGCYRFVGVYYVHGLMYREGLHPSREPEPCNYPGSSSVDEFWPLSWLEQKSKEKDACRDRGWLTLEGDGKQPPAFFEERLSQLMEKGYILDSSWTPPQSPRGDVLWLFERGFNPIPLLTEDIVLV